jgi:hypothetical protein
VTLLRALTLPAHLLHWKRTRQKNKARLLPKEKPSLAYCCSEHHSLFALSLKEEQLFLRSRWWLSCWGQPVGHRQVKPPRWLLKQLSYKVPPPSKIRPGASQGECQRHQGGGQTVRRTASVRPSNLTIVGESEHGCAKKRRIFNLRGFPRPSPNWTDRQGGGEVRAELEVRAASVSWRRDHLNPAPTI